jgi:hypothetical protein
MANSRLKRGSSGLVGNYAGGPGELVVDTTNGHIRIMDGSTQGGMAKLAYCGTDGKVNQQFLKTTGKPDAPVLTMADGATGISLSGNLTTGSFASPGFSDSHSKSQWQIATDAGFASILYDSGDSNNLTSLPLSGVSGLQPLTTYYWRVRHRGNNGGYGAWSAGRSFVTALPSGSAQFTVSGTFTVPSGVTYVHVLLVAGAGTTSFGASSSISNTGVTTGVDQFFYGNGFQLSNPVVGGGIYGTGTGIAAFKNGISVTPGSSITCTVPSGGAILVIWGTSDFSLGSGVSTSIPIVPGTFFMGGYYAGRIVISGQTYSVLVAPKATGEHSSKQWKVDNTTTSGALSFNDGLANSNAMNNSSHPAAQFCRSLSIGGYSDWYLPSMAELELCYRNLKPTTTANDTHTNFASWRSGGYNVPPTQTANGENAYSSPVGTAYTSNNPAQTTASGFRTGEAEAFNGSAYYWSSTEFGSGYGWGQTFDGGHQTNEYKTSSTYVRAARKVLVA